MNILTLKVFTDGGSLNNPGEAAIGYIIYDNNKIIFKHGEKIGVATNNFAEYTAVVKALEKLKELHTTTLRSVVVKQVHFYSDSRLMVNQLNGLFKVNNGAIRDFIIKIRILEQEIKIPIIYINIPREQNEEADKLVKQSFK